MKTYTASIGTITAKRLIDETREELETLEDYFSERAGWQNHRKPVVGKTITACAHGIQKYCESGYPYQVSTRVSGQYTDQVGVFLSSKNEAESLATEINEMNVVGLEK